MIRTRDLIIFVVVLLTLGVGIAITLVLEKGVSFNNDYTFSFEAPSSDGPTYTALNTVAEVNREDIIARLRNALSLNTPEVEPSPSVEEDSSTSTDEDSENGEVEVVDGAVVSCGTGDDSAVYAQSWPLSGVSIVLSGALRTVVHTDSKGGSVVDVNASSTASTTPIQSSEVLIAFPQTPYASAEPSCVPSDVVGVTVTGSLMFNTDASFYRGYGPDYLIGYARDGYPIYGYYQGVVDSCGGYMHASGYRYSISPQRDTVLSCYTATPASFVQ